MKPYIAMVAWCDVYMYCVAVRVHSWHPPINSVVQFVRKPNRFWRCVDPINRWPLRSDRPFDRFKYELGLAGQSKAYVLQQSFGHRSHKLGRSVTYIVGAQAPRSQLNWVRLVICQRTPHLCLCVSGRMYRDWFVAEINGIRTWIINMKTVPKVTFSKGDIFILFDLFATIDLLCFNMASLLNTWVSNLITFVQ